MIELFRYRRNDGFEPFTEWLNALRDKVAGYRVYCVRHGKAIVILLCGGDKGTQAADIKGNPTLKTLLAVLKTVGMRLSVEPEHHAPA